MADKLLEIHPFALEELRSAVNWYLERNETAAVKFAAEVDRVMELLVAAPERWPAGEHGSRKFVLRGSRLLFSIGKSRKQSRFWRLPTDTGGRDIGKTDANHTPVSLKCGTRKMGHPLIE